ncbi:hypothetical protein B0O99DRAFT_641979 [Bisporella sp. PMI_857]|nr:hypothetical protein B0O99DRAFT_641979 [Bisporella sp. PMI_857]
MKHSAANSAQADLQSHKEKGRLAVRLCVFDQIAMVLDITRDVCNIINIAHFGIQDAEKCEAETKPFVPGKDLRRFCLTSSDKAPTLVPAASRPGDLIAMIWGARLPFVVRSRQNIRIVNAEDNTVGEVEGPENNTAQMNRTETIVKEGVEGVSNDNVDADEEEAEVENGEESEDHVVRHFDEFELIGPAFVPTLMNRKAFETVKDQCSTGLVFLV